MLLAGNISKCSGKKQKIYYLVSEINLKCPLDVILFD